MKAPVEITLDYNAQGAVYGRSVGYDAARANTTTHKVYNKPRHKMHLSIPNQYGGQVTMTMEKEQAKHLVNVLLAGISAVELKDAELAK